MITRHHLNNHKLISRSSIVLDDSGEACFVGLLQWTGEENLEPNIPSFGPQVKLALLGSNWRSCLDNLVAPRKLFRDRRAASGIGPGAMVCSLGLTPRHVGQRRFKINEKFLNK